MKKIMLLMIVSMMIACSGVSKTKEVKTIEVPCTISGNYDMIEYEKLHSNNECPKPELFVSFIPIHLNFKNQACEGRYKIGGWSDCNVYTMYNVTHNPAQYNFLILCGGQEFYKRNNILVWSCNSKYSVLYKKSK